MFPEPYRENRHVVCDSKYISSCRIETVCCLYHQKKDFISAPYEPKNADDLKPL